MNQPDAAIAADLRASIIDQGYAICRAAASADEIARLRAFWLQRFAEAHPPAPIIWGPHLGEENRILYHETEDCCMYRSYDFLWNPPIDNLTRAVGLRLSRLRNDVAGVDHRSGEYFEQDRYGIYITTSYYPPNTGWLKVHEDRTDERRHWHFMLLLTFKGEDYKSGGLYIRDRSGNRVDVDAQVSPGDAVFFDGSLAHDVAVIEPADTEGLGRLQLFSIPTFMERPQDNDRAFENLSFGAYLKARLRSLKYRWLHRAKVQPSRTEPRA